MRRAAAFSVVACLAASLPSMAARAAERPHQTSSEAPVLVTADQVQYDQELGLVVARGNVEISQKDQILLADTVTYNQRTDTVTASGHVSLLQEPHVETLARLLQQRLDDSLARWAPGDGAGAGTGRSAAQAIRPSLVPAEMLR